MKIKKLYLYGFLSKIMVYLFFIFMIITLFFFDYIVMGITGVVLIVLYIIVHKIRVKLLKKEIVSLKEMKDEIDVGFKKGGITFPFSVKSVINYLELKKSDLKTPELFVEAILGKSKDFNVDLISYFVKVFIEKLKESLEILLNFIDREEYELNKFITNKRKNYYTFWAGLEVVVLLCAIFVLFYSSFLSGKFALIYLFISYLIVIFFVDINSFINQTFDMGYYRYIQSRKILGHYSKLLNLMCNNSFIYSSEKFNEVTQILTLFNSKFSYYGTAITPNYSYLKKFEVFTVLSVIIPFIIIIFQDIFSSIGAVMLESIILIILKLLFIITMLIAWVIEPIRTNRKKFKEEIDYNKLKEKMDKNIEFLNIYHYGFISHSTEE